MSTVDPDLPDPPEPGAPGSAGGDAGVGAGPAQDVDAAFAAIIAGWDDPVGPVRSWPAREDVDPATAASTSATTVTPGPPHEGPPVATGVDTGTAPARGAGPGPEVAGRRSQGRSPQGPGSRGSGSEARGSEGRGSESRGSESRGSEGRGSEGRGSESHGAAGEEGWTPPELPPMGRAGWRTWLPWAGVLGSPAFFLVVVLVPLALPDLALLAGVAAFMAGFVTLVLRLPYRREDDGDDGAVL